jgi:2-polyprenyl-3-methyl-5-hydroxy-6-metoxy-1,4-benzoquinol methylase
MSAERFHEAYRGTPPWDIGRPQPVFERLAAAGAITGRVLDVGCGTGENALFLAGQGHEVTGVDAVPAAVVAARRKARERGIDADFVVHDALALGELGRRFDTVVDSGLFHTFDDEERVRFADSLAAVLEPAGRYFMLCFSEYELREGGPRRVAQVDIRAVFDRTPFRVVAIEAAEMATRLDGDGRKAWLARIECVETRP